MSEYLKALRASRRKSVVEIAIEATAVDTVMAGMSPMLSRVCDMHLCGWTAAETAGEMHLSESEVRRGCEIASLELDRERARLWALHDAWYGKSGRNEGGAVS